MQCPPATLRSSQPERVPQRAVSVLGAQLNRVPCEKAHALPHVRTQVVPEDSTMRRVSARVAPAIGVPLRLTLTRNAPWSLLKRTCVMPPTVPALSLYL